MTDPITVTTQAELDAAIAAGARVIDIRSEPGSYITVRAYGSATVTARPRVAVHCHSRRATIVGGGVIIDH
ncbi:hypothetical protein, partial [Streptomyces sp. P17]|uniref:hypothetical protein n=1 Tax=Streptomyces sp. P17 TaxID=3074716 RepID=UPI0028F440CD